MPIPIRRWWRWQAKQPVQEKVVTVNCIIKNETSQTDLRIKFVDKMLQNYSGQRSNKKSIKED
ncbi:hypothetical protein VrSk94_06830 [Vibrio rotiferianus]